VSQASAFRRQLASVGLPIVLLALVLAALSPSVAAATPRAGDRFEYDYNTNVDGGSGDYYGYTDHMRSHSSYSVQSVSGDQVTVRGLGSWTFDGSDGTHQSGVVDVTPVFSLSTRRYISGIDVNTTAPNPSVWFWISTPVRVGDTVPVLDDVFTVTSTDSTIWFGLAPRKALLLEASGTYTRNDSYGKFEATYHDRYYFDRDSGFIVAEQFDEQDTNVAAGFHYHAEVAVTSTSYPIPLDWVDFALVDLGVPAIAVGLVLASVRVRRGPGRFAIGSKDFPTEVRIRKAKKPADVTNLEPDGSPFFAPFLPVFAERSIAEGDPVILALADGKIVGMSLYDQESMLGSLFASEDKVARVLLKRSRLRDFFADGTIPSRILDAKEIDRFTILQLQSPSALPYDASVVRPMQAGDLPAVVALAEEVYRGRARKFVESSFRGGDLGFVAMSGSRLAGFGFAMVVGSIARLHTLTVSARDRARGLGTDLTNARLTALNVLGVDRVIVEISRQNVASLRIATRAGFVPIGDTVYYSRKPEAAPTALQRQT
jgi:ribosomal protein S18 acetylase RimI-like enzyme